MLTCKQCNRRFCEGVWMESPMAGLLRYERLCPRCVPPERTPSVPEGHDCEATKAEKPIKITVETLIWVISMDFCPHAFHAFHLEPCHCGLPTWQQPCRWCRYYPMGRDLGTNKPRGWMGHTDWLKLFDGGRDIFLHYVSTSFGCVVSCDRLADQVLPKAAMHQWPTAQEIWEAFGPNADAERRKQLDGWHASDEQGERLNYYRWILTDRSYARHFQRLVRCESPRDDYYGYHQQEAARYPRQAEDKLRRFAKKYGEQEAQKLLAEIQEHEQKLPECG